MAAPGALAISKTMFPETKKTKADWTAIRTIPKGYLHFLILLNFNIIIKN
jgi:hypothetical protein